jgi:prefoldin subunit 5
LGLLCLRLYLLMCHGQVEAVSAGIKELQAQAASFNKDAAKVRGSIAAADTALEAIRSSRAALMEAATLEQVGLLCWCA